MNLWSWVFNEWFVFIEFFNIFLVFVKFLVDADVFGVGELVNFIRKESFLSATIFFGVSFDFEQQLSKT